MKPKFVALLFAAGVFLGQLAWIAAVPPYRGIDEFDHVYRAASVAEGYWSPGVGTPENGRGDLVPVPPRIVNDGAEVCRSFKYTGPDNCQAVSEWSSDLVTVASAAARYNPVFYWLIGKPAQLAQGADAVYVMRLGASLICAALVGLAAWVTARWSRTRWPLTALALTLTPVLIYSTAMPAPNGIEMAGALCVWCGLLGLTQTTDRRSLLILVGVAAAGAVPLVAVRSLGPAWLLLTIFALLATLEGKLVWRAVRRIPVAFGSATVLVTTCGATALWWSRASETNALEPLDIEPISPWLPVLKEVPLWFFQSIAAFPLRNEPAPDVVYVCETIAFIVFVGWAMLRSAKRVRRGLALTGFLSLAIPYALTIATVMTAGLIWQGRYTMPFSFGVVLIAGFGLERAYASARIARPLLVILGLSIAAAHVVSAVNVQALEVSGSPLSGDPRWISLPLWVTGLLAALSVIAWLTAVLRHQPDPDHLAESSRVSGSRLQSEVAAGRQHEQLIGRSTNTDSSSD